MFDTPLACSLSVRVYVCVCACVRVFRSVSQNTCIHIMRKLNMYGTFN